MRPFSSNEHVYVYIEGTRGVVARSSPQNEDVLLKVDTARSLRISFKLLTVLLHVFFRVQAWGGASNPPFASSHLSPND